MAVELENKESEEVIYANMDDAWKHVLNIYFKQFLELCWKEAHQNIDWDKGYEFLEQELPKIAIPKKKGKRIIDKLAKVWHKSGSENYILLNFEVQGDKEDDFEERMYICNYRIFERYQRPVASFVILIDSNKNWRPKEYKHELFGFSHQMKFPIFKLLDFVEPKQTTTGTRNPFIIIFAAQHKALSSKNQEQRLANKLSIIKSLYKNGYSREEIINIGYFLTGIFALSKEKKLIYNQTVQALEEEINVSYLNTFEEMGIEKGFAMGLEKGLQKGESAVLSRQLELKFKTIPQDYRQKIEQATSELLIKWAERILFCKTLEQIFED